MRIALDTNRYVDFAKGDKTALGTLRKTHAIHKARSEGRILGLPRGQKQFLSPVWQFSSGKILPGLKEAYDAIDGSPWMRASFMLSPNTRLNDQSPLAVLKRGEIARVVAAAKAYGEHGAA